MLCISQSSVTALQGRSRAPKGLVGQKSDHVSKQLRHDPRHHAPYRSSSRFFHLELILQRAKHAFYASSQAAMPGPESRFFFRGGLSASPERIPEGSAVFAKETCEPIPAISIVGQHRTGLREKRRLPGLPVGLDRQHMLGHVSLSNVRWTEHKVGVNANLVEKRRRGSSSQCHSSSVIASFSAALSFGRSS